MDIINLFNKSQIDIEKKELMDSVRPSFEDKALYFKKDYAISSIGFQSRRKSIGLEKSCPICNRKFTKFENFCPYCSVKLTKKQDILNIKIPYKSIRTNIELTEIFTKENTIKLAEFNFTNTDLNQITKNFKTSSIKTLDKTLKENNLDFDNLFIKDKILIYTKTFTEVTYKSQGAQLGFYEFNRISIDDRQSNTLQTTTLIHELAHFLLAEIFAEIISKTLNLDKSPQIKAIAHYILNYNDFVKLLDEYCAHTVEARFTLFGFQDYSSFKNLLNNSNLSEECIDLAKLIGNSYANLIIKILESVINQELRDEIKREFKSDYMTPNYDDLKFETCHMLTDEGLIESFKYLINTGFEIASNNIEIISEYSKNFQ